MQAHAELSDMPVIPAMTTAAERECYYRMVREGAAKGAVVELGAWLGASTAYIAAGMRDAGVEAKAQVYDRFLSKPGHVEKVKAWYDGHGVEEQIPLGDAFAQFKANLGPLIGYVEPHQCEIAAIHWRGGPISVLISDAPKRVPEISAVLTAFTGALQPGAVMAWQDFCHFPSYEIPACLYRLRGHLEFVEAVVPGTTLAFRITSEWNAAEVAAGALAVKRWTPAEINAAWDYWLAGPVPLEKASLFRCGAALFLCDIGRHSEAVETLESVLTDDAGAILPKWRYLKRVRPNLVRRYQPLFDHLGDALCST